MNSKLEISSRDGKTIIKVSGQFDFNTSRQFLEYIPELIDKTAILIDFSDCHYLDSSGLGCILKLKKSLSDHAAKIEFFGCNEKILNVMQMMKIN